MHRLQCLTAFAIIAAGIGGATSAQANMVVGNAVRAGDESRSNRIHVPIAIFALLSCEEPLRHDHMQMIFGARHRDI